MRPNRLSDILSDMTAIEWKGVNGYIKAQTKKDSDVRAVWDGLMVHKKQLNHLLSEADEYNKLFNTQFSYSYFKKMSATILGYVDEYLFIQDIRSDKTNYEVDKIKIYYKRNLYYHGDFLSNRLTKQLSNRNIDSLSKAKVTMVLMHNRFYSEHPNKAKDAPVLLRQISDSLLQYTTQLAALLKLEMLNRSNLLNESYDQEISDLNSFIHLKDEDELVLLFTNIYNVLSEQETSIEDIVLTLQRTPSILEPQIEKAIIILLTNYLSQEIKKGRRLDKISSLLELNKIGVNRGTLFKDGLLPLPRMINIIEFASVNNEIEWAETFSNEYLHIVRSIKGDIIAPYIKANILFYRKRYDEAFAIFKELNLPSVGEQLRRTELMIICAYEIYGNGEPDFVMNYLKNYQQWLDAHAKELNVVNHKGAKNLIKFVRLLLKSPTLSDLKDFIKSTSILRKRSWAIQKIEIY